MLHISHLFQNEFKWLSMISSCFWLSRTVSSAKSMNWSKLGFPSLTWGFKNLLEKCSEELSKIQIEYYCHHWVRLKFTEGFCCFCTHFIWKLQETVNKFPQRPVFYTLSTSSELTQLNIFALKVPPWVPSTIVSSPRSSKWLNQNTDNTFTKSVFQN